MARLVRFRAGDGEVAVAVDETPLLPREPREGVEEISREGTLSLAAQKLEDALSVVRRTAEAAQTALGDLMYQELELEIGVTLSGEAGAFIARSKVEAQLVVHLRWGRGETNRSHSV